MDLTKRQKEIFDYIRRYASRYGYPPTVREIGKAVGLHSSSTVHAHLANLEKVGLLRRDPTKPRAIELLVGPGEEGDGTVGPAARGSGRRRRARARRGERRGLPRGADRRSVATMGTTCLRVKGDSMKDAGILEGDYVVVQQTDDAANGSIVVAMIEDEATVKRFYREKDRVRLQPANKAYKPIRTRDAKVLGRVVGVFRSL